MSGSIVAFREETGLGRASTAGLATRLRQLAGALLAEWQLRRDLAHLQSLDGRALHDIGLTRGSLEGAVRHGRGRHWQPRTEPGEPIRELAEWPVMPISWTEWR